MLLSFAVFTATSKRVEPTSTESFASTSSSHKGNYKTNSYACISFHFSLQLTALFHKTIFQSKIMYSCLYCLWM